MVFYQYKTRILLCYGFSLALMINILLSPPELFNNSFTYRLLNGPNIELLQKLTPYTSYSDLYGDDILLVGTIKASTDMICINGEKLKNICISWNSQTIKNILKNSDLHECNFIPTFMSFSLYALFISFIFLSLTVMLIQKSFSRYEYIYAICINIAFLFSLISTIIMIYLCNKHILLHNVFIAATYEIMNTVVPQKSLEGILFGNTININHNIFNSYILSLLAMIISGF